MLEETPEQIAAGLSEAQRDTLLDNRRCVRSYKPAQKLVTLGLWTGEGDEYAIYARLTDLGRAVVATLTPQVAA